MRKILQNNSLNELLQKKGYVVVDLLDRKEIEYLKTNIDKYNTSINNHFYTSFWSSDIMYKKNIDNLIMNIIGAKAVKLFCNYYPFLGEILVKSPSLTKEFSPHQDWTFVEEPSFTSYFCWVALQDTNYMNGALQVVEKTHLFLDTVRGANIEVSYKDIIKQMKQYLVTIPLKAGQAIMFNQALLHASPPNRTFRNRLAAGVVFLPEKMPIYHYFKDKESNKIITEFK